MIKASYFSYKGGSGRSSMVYNTIPYIAKELNATANEPIILLDLDIDSAGLTFLLKKNDFDSSSKYTVNDVIEGKIPGTTLEPDEMELQQHPFFSKLIPVGNEFGLLGSEADRSILFIPTKPGNKLDLDKDNYDIAGNKLDTLRSLCNKYHCKAIIFDTPAGDQLTAKWALDTSSKIITCMRITTQFREGTMDYLDRKMKIYARKEFILVPNAVPTEKIVIDGIEFNYEGAKEEIVRGANKISLINKDNDNIVNVEMVGLNENYFGVNEVKRFKFKEGILFRVDYNTYTEDEKNAVEAYKRLAKIVCRG